MSTDFLWRTRIARSKVVKTIRVRYEHGDFVNSDETVK